MQWRVGREIGILKHMKHPRINALQGVIDTPDRLFILLQVCQAAVRTIVCQRSCAGWWFSMDLSVSGQTLAALKAAMGCNWTLRCQRLPDCPQSQHVDPRMTCLACCAAAATCQLCWWGIRSSQNPSACNHSRS